MAFFDVFCYGDVSHTLVILCSAHVCLLSVAVPIKIP